MNRWALGISLVVVGLMCGCSKKTPPTSSPVTVEYEAKGIVTGFSVLEEARKESCPGAEYLCNGQTYMTSAGQIVVFRGDDGRTILIPMRTQAVGAAVPLSTEAKDVTEKVADEKHSSVGWTSFETKTIHLPACIHHGILRYHACGNDLYCFDSWEDQ